MQNPKRHGEFVEYWPFSLNFANLVLNTDAVCCVLAYKNMEPRYILQNNRTRGVRV